MKIGSKYVSEQVFPRHFDQLAEEAKLGKPRIKQRIQELARLTQSKLSDVTPDNSAGLKLAEIIRQRCERAIAMFEV